MNKIIHVSMRNIHIMSYSDSKTFFKMSYIFILEPQSPPTNKRAQSEKLLEICGALDIGFLALSGGCLGGARGMTGASVVKNHPYVLIDRSPWMPEKKNPHHWQTRKRSFFWEIGVFFSGDRCNFYVLWNKTKVLFFPPPHPFSFSRSAILVPDFWLPRFSPGGPGDTFT